MAVSPRAIERSVATVLLTSAKAVDVVSGVGATIDAAAATANVLRVIGIARRQPAVPAARRVARALEEASAWVPGVRCVHRAAAGKVWLAVLGVPSQIVVGVRKDERWQGHAWLEVQNEGSQLVVFAEEVAFSPVWRRR